MGRFLSTKVFDGFSTVFRQWKAETTHCKYLHGYGVSFKLWFEGDLDERNWVWDFGGMKRAEGKIDGILKKKMIERCGLRALQSQLQKTTIITGLKLLKGSPGKTMFP